MPVAGLLLALLAFPIGAKAETQLATDLLERFSGSLTELPSAAPTVSGSFCVPVYSSISMVPDKLRADFSVALSIHNASETRPLILKRIDYFDTSGKLVESYLKRSIALKPVATVEVFIATTDVRAGTGANFVVDWGAGGDIAEPVVEALMIGSIGGGHYAFVSQGRSIRLIGSKM